MTPDQLVAYYVKLLIMEYYALPNASGMVAAFVRQAIASLIVVQVRAGFTLATSTGKQLDLLGELVGLERSVPGFTPGIPAFSMPRYSDPDAGTYVGFSRYGASIAGAWDRYTDIPTSYIMADGVFAQFIAILVAIRASDYSLEALDAIFFSFFGTYVKIVDNGNMTMTYQHATADPGVLFAILEHLDLLPNPAGVSYNVTTF
jgi:hypothetical protein